MRIVAPTFTQTPNDLFDHWLPLLKESELKVLLVIMRKTFGWNKVRDRISNSQLVKLTGQSSQSVKDAIKSLQSKGLILKETIGKLGTQETYYELIVDDDSNNSDRAKFYPGGGLNSSPGEGQILAPQKKELNTPAKEQQQNLIEPAAAVSSCEIFECLKDVDIPEVDKRWLMVNSNIEDIKHAIAWATHPTIKLTKPLAAALKWACKEKPELPEMKADIAKQNHQYSKEIEAKYNGVNGHQITACGTYIDIVNGPYMCALTYEENGFKDQLNSLLRKRGII
jgi:phage replication O-like protein O